MGKDKAKQEQKEVQDGLKNQDQENKAAMKDAAATAKQKATDAAKKAVKTLEEGEDAKIMAKVEHWATDHAKAFARKYIDELDAPPADKTLEEKKEDVDRTLGKLNTSETVIV